MKTTITAAFILLLFLTACKHQNTNEGFIAYQLEYQLPDSLKQYTAFLPKEAVVYFKGDSTVSLQKSNEESTTVITNRKTGFMRVLLKSPVKQFVITKPSRKKK